MPATDGRTSPMPASVPDELIEKTRSDYYAWVPWRSVWCLSDGSTRYAYLSYDMTGGWAVVSLAGHRYPLASVVRIEDGLTSAGHPCPLMRYDTRYGEDTVRLAGAPLEADL